MAQRSGRVVCPRCGSNNFDTVTACWKCSAPLGGAAAPAPGYVPSQPTSNVTAAMPRGVETDGFAQRAMYQATVAAHQVGDAARANRAAFWLGMMFPYFGFPIGLA